MCSLVYFAKSNAGGILYFVNTGVCGDPFKMFGKRCICVHCDTQHFNAPLQRLPTANRPTCANLVPLANTTHIQMPKRFEIVQPPVEQRLQRGLTAQLAASVNTAHSLLSSLSNRTNIAFNATSAALSDQELVTRVSTASVKLLSPFCLPGCLFATALLLRVVHFVFLNRLARRAVSDQYSLQQKTD